MQNRRLEYSYQINGYRPPLRETETLLVHSLELLYSNPLVSMNILPDTKCTLKREREREREGGIESEKKERRYVRTTL